MARSSRYNKGGPLKGGIFSYRLDVQAQIFTPREARAEYARLRREANRRLEVLGRSEFANLQAVKNRPQGFGALPRTASEQQIRKQLYDVARYLNLRTSSLQGVKRSQREFVKTMNELGYDFVNKRNASEFGKFMGAVDKHFGSKTFDSEQKIEMYKIAKQKRIDPQELALYFDFWVEHKGELESAPAAPSTVSSEEFAERIGLSID